MSKLSKTLMAIATIIIVGIIGKAFVLNEDVKIYAVTFFFVGAGLALLRLFINAMIGKMKGKNIFVKIGFFAALLSVGIPFQNWFRTDVLFAMDSSFIAPSIAVLVSSLVLMTIVYDVIGKYMKKEKEEQIATEA